MAKTPKTIGSLNPFVWEHKSSNSRYSICAKTLLLSQRIAGQQKTGYSLRNLVGLAMQGYKRIFGNTMKATRAAAAKNGSMGLCVCAQQND